MSEMNANFCDFNSSDSSDYGCQFQFSSDSGSIYECIDYCTIGQNHSNMNDYMEERNRYIERESIANLLYGFNTN